MEYNIDLDAVEDSVYTLDAMRIAAANVHRMTQLAGLDDTVREPWMFGIVAAIAVQHLIDTLRDSSKLLNTTIADDDTLTASVTALRHMSSDIIALLQVHDAGNGAQLTIYDALAATEARTAVDYAMDTTVAMWHSQPHRHVARPQS